MVLFEFFVFRRDYNNIFFVKIGCLFKGERKEDIFICRVFLIILKIEIIFCFFDALRFCVDGDMLIREVRGLFIEMESLRKEY